MTIFSNRIKCGECGHWFGTKVWHSTDRYRRVVYQCNQKFDRKCSTPHLVEEEIKMVFVKAVNELLVSKDALLENLQMVLEQICGTADLETESKRLMGEMQMLADTVQNCINDNARIAQDQTDYQRRYDELVSRYDAAKGKYDRVCKAITERRTKAETLDGFAKAIKAQECAVTEFDEGLWGILTDFMTVYSKNDIGVTFKDGTEIYIR